MGVLALGYVFLVVSVLCLGYFFFGAVVLLVVGSFAFFLWVWSEMGDSRLLLPRFSRAFWLFILGEFLIFLTLFVGCLWAQSWGDTPISDWLELPLLGCFLLLGSSVTATAFHHSALLKGSLFFLISTIFLGCCFLLLQFQEFYDCECDLLGSAYYAASFCTVGLHFTHVLAGVLLFLSILFIGVKKINSYYIDLVVWYWHFVDYIWLIVFTVIYMP